MRASFPIALLVVLVAVAGCSSPTDLKSPPPEANEATIDLDLLTRHWVHSFEEDGDVENGQVYRPAGSREFAPAWFRMAYVFHADGDLEWLALAPDDAHHLEAGTWRLDPPATPFVHLQSDGPHLLQILELTENVLRIREVPIR